MRTVTVPITTDANGAGTAHLSSPINGEIVQVRTVGSQWGTANLTVTRDEDGYTVFTGAVGGTLWNWPRPPVDGYLTFKVANGGSKKLDTVKVFYSDD